MPTPDELASPEYQAAVKRADAALQRKAAVISGHRLGPRIVWTLYPWSHDDIRSLVSADGNAPLIPHEVLALPRTVLMWAGAPHWCQYAYLVNVSVKATFADSQR
jgi:hypothetical protein